MLERRPEGRINRLFLTEKGRQIYAEVVPAHDALIVGLLGTLEARTSSAPCCVCCASWTTASAATRSPQADEHGPGREYRRHSNGLELYESEDRRSDSSFDHRPDRP